MAPTDNEPKDKDQDSTQEQARRRRRGSRGRRRRKPDQATPAGVENVQPESASEPEAEAPAAGEAQEPARRRPTRRRRPVRSGSRVRGEQASQDAPVEEVQRKEPVAERVPEPEPEPRREERAPRGDRERPIRRRHPEHRPRREHARLPGEPRSKAAIPPAARHDRYAAVARDCDLVFGESPAGIYVHTAAALELAKDYRFRAIAASGFGAFAAALTAAAEKGRVVPAAGFGALGECLRALASAETAESARMAGLFPSPAAKREVKSNGSTAGFPWKAGAGAAIGLGLAGWAAMPGNLPMVGIAGVVAAIAGFAWETATVTKGLAVAEAGNPGFGLETGATVTAWLSARVNTLAGMKEHGRPLTFGDLTVMDEGVEGGTRLLFTAADLSLGLPLTLPFAHEGDPAAETMYYFRPQELALFFPANVIEWLERAARRGSQYRRHEGFLPLPLDDDLPVVFAARLSLGVCPHLGPVPLYRPRSEGDGWHMKRCWIAGGAAAGAHVHAFDQPLPSWPTFAFAIAEAEAVDGAGVWTQTQMRETAPMHWQAIEDHEQYLRAVQATSRDWRDRQALQSPGYRERMALVTVPAAALESPALIPVATARQLADLGRQAANRLAQRFTDDSMTPGLLSWDAHRWIRYRASMALLESHLQMLRHNYYDTADGDRTYDQLVLRGREAEPDVYRWKDFAQRNHALRVTAQLLDLIERWEKDKLSFGGGDMPTPLPRLRILPRD